MKPRLTYDQIKVQGRQMHALEYHPRKALGDFKIVLIFDPETFRHIRTEYKLWIQAAMGTVDTHYLLSEDFADFKEVEGMILPRRYTISFSSEGRVSTYLAHWIFDAKLWVHNGQIDSRLFKTPQ